MAPRALVTGKKGLDGFPGTDLEELLVKNGIKTVALGGFLTNCCVESTMRTAYEKGFAWPPAPEAGFWGVHNHHVAVC